MSFRRRMRVLRHELATFLMYGLWSPLLLASLLNHLSGDAGPFRHDTRALQCAIMVMFVDLGWTVASGLRRETSMAASLGIWRFGVLAGGVGCSALVLAGSTTAPPMYMLAMFATGALALIHHQNKVRNV